MPEHHSFRVSGAEHHDEPDLPAHERVSRAVRNTRARLREAGIASADAEARVLVSHAAQAGRSLILIDALPTNFADVLASALARRVGGEPLQLIVGRVGFRGVSLEVRKGVFIPRPETEVAIDIVHRWRTREYGRSPEHASHEPVPAVRVLDACTGTGALAAAILHEIPESHVVACDVNPAAVSLASRNLAEVATPDRFDVRVANVNAGLDDGAGRGTGSRWGVDAASIDVVVSNPPYIPARAVPRDRDVLMFDPPNALFGGGEDGMGVPRAVIALAAFALRPGGVLVMEHADCQGEITRAAALETGRFEDPRTERDLTGRERFLVAQAA